MTQKRKRVYSEGDMLGSILFYDIKKLYSSTEGFLGKVCFFFPSLFYLVLFPPRWLQSPRGPHGNLVKR